MYCCLDKDRILNYLTARKEQLQTDEGLTDEEFTNEALWFNCDDTMIRYDLPLRVLAENGFKNVFKRSVNEKDGLTVLACVSAKDEYLSFHSSTGLEFLEIELLLIIILY